MKKFIRILAGIRVEIWLFAAAVIAGACATVIVYREGLLVGTGDQAAHLNLARLPIDSLTPGITQVGFMWRPLIHMLLVPFTAFDMLYRTGAAAPLLLVPCLGVSTSVFYLILRKLGCSLWWSVTGAVLFLIQPYVLYFSVVPMTEMLFITVLFLTTLLYMSWYESDRIVFALLAGLMVSLAFLARIEGIILMPLVFIFLVAGLVRRRASITQSIALLFLFSMLGGIGMLLTVLYGFFYGDGPLAFLSPSELISTVPAVPKEVGPQNVQATIGFLESWYPILEKLKRALWFVIGYWLLIVASVSAPLVLISKKIFSRAMPLLLLLSPLLFLAYALYARRAGFAVPSIPFLGPDTIIPKGSLLDVRYTLTSIGFIIASPVLLASMITEALRNRGQTYLSRAAFAVLFTVIVGSSFPHVVRLVQADFIWVRSDLAFAGQPGTGVYAPGEYLRDHYDFGFVLASHQNNDRTFLTSYIPLNRYVYESNYRYFQQAAREPWLFARWVIVSRDGGGAVNPFIYRTKSMPEFAKYYTLEFENERTEIYKLNESFLRKEASELGIPPLELPSLNADITRWDPVNFYYNLRSLQQVD